MFAENFFNRKKVISSKFKGYFGEMQRKRNIADYRIGISKKIVKSQLISAKHFIDVIFGEMK